MTRALWSVWKRNWSVRGTIQNNQFFRFRSFFVLGTDARQPQAGTIGVIARNNEQSPRFQLIGREVWCGAEEYDAINLRPRGLD